MKRFSTAIVFTIAAIFLCSGCSNNTTSDLSSSEIIHDNSIYSSKGDGSSLTSTANAATSDDISYSAMLPDAKEFFPNGEVIIIDDDGGSSYTFQVTGYNDGEYESYIEKCKELGFSKVQFDIETETNNTFEARSEDEKYYISLQLLHETKVLNVTCAKRRNTD